MLRRRCFLCFGAVRFKTRQRPARKATRGVYGNRRAVAIADIAQGGIR